jgi:hypothetical protein
VGIFRFGLIVGHVGIGVGFVFFVGCGDGHDFVGSFVFFFDGSGVFLLSSLFHPESLAEYIPSPRSRSS